MAVLGGLLGCGSFEYAQGVTSYEAGTAPAGCRELGGSSATAPYRGQALRELQHQARLAGGNAIEVLSEARAPDAELRIYARLLDCRRASARLHSSASGEPEARR